SPNPSIIFLALLRYSAQCGVTDTDPLTGA
ncbi:hypothetical protein GBAR_LOCUS12586, partial [Geodia barretti]